MSDIFRGNVARQTRDLSTEKTVRKLSVVQKQTQSAAPVIRKPVLAAIVGFTVLVGGCQSNPFQTENPYTGEQEVNKTTKGAGIGAVAGLVAGAIAGGSRKNLLIGAGVGALAGGLVGNYMDRQDAKLRAQLRGTGVSVTRIGDQIVLNMPGNVTFASNSSNISSDFYDVLRSVSLVLNEFEKTYVDVVGHTDSTGSLELNQRLSEQRAASVARYLESQEVLSERILTRGMGPSSPVATNDTMEGRSLNRRVEIFLTPIT
ncbi:MAG: OmpA family protein [Gammaproteobacteria bacterium]|nr:OmpA family protein [Gammaproteobacteria bacterium]